MGQESGAEAEAVGAERPKTGTKYLAGGVKAAAPRIAPAAGAARPWGQ